MNAVNWFEIPVADFERATHYYETVLGISFIADDGFPGMKMGIFPHDKPGVGGAIIAGEGHTPGASGTLIYLPAPALDNVLDRVDSAGGKVILGKTSLGPEIGHIAVMCDSEGNHIGLHQPT